MSTRNIQINKEINKIILITKLTDLVQHLVKNISMMNVISNRLKLQNINWQRNSWITV